MKKKNIARTVLLSSLVLGMAISPALAATEHWNDGSTGNTQEWQSWVEEWKTVENTRNYVSVNVGSTIQELRFAWYSDIAVTGNPTVKISTNADMKDAKIIQGTQATAIEGFHTNKVTVSGLKENTTYYYETYVGETKNSDVTKIKTGNSDQFKFLLFGDPQIGASSGQYQNGDKLSGSTTAARNDAYNWNKTLNIATSKNPDASLILTAGDQVNTADSESQYSGFLYSPVLKSLPLSTAIGNHEMKKPNYSYHYNNPNEVKNTNDTTTGHDYYYTYGDALFIILNTNNLNCADHENTIKKAISDENGKNAKWRIVMFHQDIYGSGYDHSDSDGMILRTQLTPLMDKYDVDVVLQGHDHTYSRSYLLKGDGKTHQAYTNKVTSKGDSEKYDQLSQEKKDYLDDNNCYTITDKTQGKVINPDGTLYVETNSGTGSKFYELMPTKQDYIAARSQNWNPTYSVVEMNEVSFTINTYEIVNGKAQTIDQSFTIVKEANKEQLKALLNEVEALLKDTSYTEASLKGLQVAYNNAKKVFDNVNASEDDVKNAYADLTKAKTTLEKKVEIKPTVPTKPETPETKPTTPTTQKPTESTTKPTTSTAVNTSDSMNVLPFVVTGVVALSSGAVVIMRMKKKEVEE